jgi:nucleoside-diphosphate-sugar epimerase
MTTDINGIVVAIQGRPLSTNTPTTNQVLGWTAKTSLEEGLRRTID